MTEDIRRYWTNENHLIGPHTDSLLYGLMSGGDQLEGAVEVVLLADAEAAVAAAEQRGREKCHDWRLHTAELERLLNAEGTAAHAAGVEHGYASAWALAVKRYQEAGTLTTDDALAAITTLRH